MTVKELIYELETYHNLDDEVVFFDEVGTPYAAVSTHGTKNYNNTGTNLVSIVYNF